MDRNRLVLLNKISKTGFVLGELHLFLNTHPTDMNALKHYEFYQKKHEELTKEYESAYGPLTPKMINCPDRWNWIDGPWPWEREFYDEEIY
jgi:spore coat protein JB